MRIHITFHNICCYISYAVKSNIYVFFYLPDSLLKNDWLIDEWQIEWIWNDPIEKAVQ